MFQSVLRRTRGAVFACFESESNFISWVETMESAYSRVRAGDDKLRELLNRLCGSWLTRLCDGDATEATGILDEAVVHALRGDEACRASRRQFSYCLADNILNKGVRRFQSSLPTVTACHQLRANNATPAALDLTIDQREKIDQLLISYLSARQPNNEVATPEVVIAVKNAWKLAIDEVELEKGPRAAKPFAMAVKEKIAAELDVEVRVVEAAMKRLRRAILKQPEREEFAHWLIS